VFEMRGVMAPTTWFLLLGLLIASYLLKKVLF
jgi:hypothetical protein